MISNDGEIEFHFVKSPTYRTIHVDGVFGGLTPHGKVDVAFYCERFAIPQSTTHLISSEGRLGKEIRRESKNGVVREIEFNIIMDVEVAKRMIEFLNKKVKEATAAEKKE